jgi:DNA-directed RNA polymerase specialized sigma24 family protein
VARDADIERRLINWADWLAGLRSRGLGFATCNMAAERVDGEGYDAPSRNPIIDDEAEITDKAVRELQPPELQRTVVLVYAGPGGIRRIAQQMGVAEVTVYTRIGQAHRKISVWLSDRTEQARIQLERDAALRQSARTAI